jgi:hypothetical protein
VEVAAGRVEEALRYLRVAYETSGHRSRRGGAHSNWAFSPRRVTQLPADFAANGSEIIDAFEE